MQKYIQRIEKKRIQDKLFKGKIVIMYGARQVGKTTLSKDILSEFGEKGKYLNCELLSVQEGLSHREADKLKAYLGDYKLIVLDEAQHIPDIGKKLKIIVDTFPDLQIIATGSSSFDLASKVSEPLTGRTFVITLYPLSLMEISKHTDRFSLDATLDLLLRFGSYPEVFSLPEKEATERLNEISSNYLYKDILKFEGIRKSSVVRQLLQLLALQIGRDISYNELAGELGINRATVIKYIDILEQSFVIFRLSALSRNRRKEVSKSVKIYFVDVGMRNSIIQNYNPLSLRDNKGALWENFCVSERIKYNAHMEHFVNPYFWRSYTKKEVDYVEESGGEIRGYEFKFNPQKKISPPKEFISSYKGTVERISRDTYDSFLLS